MFMRWVWPWSLLFCLGCQSSPPPATITKDRADSTAINLWAEGQSAMQQGRTLEAVAYYERSLEADPAYSQSHLSLAAACLEKGDETSACDHLMRFVEARPENWIARARLGELLLRRGRFREAREQFAGFDAAAQDQGEAAVPLLVQCHSKLAQIAEEEKDDYAEHLHRGIGLYYLARERAWLPDPNGQLPVEGLLFQSAGELSLARKLRPSEARPSWYLHEVWARLAQRRPAQRHLREADAAAPFAFLTPAERRDLHLACLRESDTKY